MGFLWGGGSDSQNYYGYLFLRRDAPGSTICSCKVKFFRLRRASLSKYNEVITQISPHLLPLRGSFGNDLFFGKKIFRPSATPIIKHSPYIVKLEMTFICDLYLFMNLFIIRFVHMNVYMPIFKINKKTVSWFLCDSNSPQIFSQKDNFFNFVFIYPSCVV